MTQQMSATPDYTMGFSEELIASLKRFNAETSAFHLIPYLRPGLRVLDFGCGPGIISVGLAKYIDPGELCGVDMEESQIDLARDLARASGRPNAIFHVGDVTDLPFEDGFFDVAHGHNILMHIPDTTAALAEVKRVLKPGGILGCREMIGSASFVYPDMNIIPRSWDMLADLLSADDGHPDMGRDMKDHILQAGFDNIRMSASFNTYSSPEEVEFIYNLGKDWLLSSEITLAAIKYGAWTEELSRRLRIAYEKWKVHPAAFVGVAYGEAIANKP